MKILIALLTLFACWILYVSITEAMDGFGRFERMIDCTFVQYEDGSAKPVETDFEADQCLKQHGEQPEFGN